MNLAAEDNIGCHVSVEGKVTLILRDVNELKYLHCVVFQSVNRCTYDIQ